MTLQASERKCFIFDKRFQKNDSNFAILFQKQKKNPWQKVLFSNIDLENIGNQNWFSYSKDMAYFEAFLLGHFIKHNHLINISEDHINIAVIAAIKYYYSTSSCCEK